MKRLVCVALFASLGGAQVDLKTSRENMTRDRGQTPLQRPSATLTLQGMLFDAACKDRSAPNLSTPAETLANTMPVETPAETKAATRKNTGAVSSHGITVDQKTLAAERSDVLPHQVPDLRTRQMDPTCAITGATSAYAVRLDDGRILNLDEGGNTFAAEAVLLSSEGRAMLNGVAYGFKPRVKVVGQIRGDRIVVQELSFS